MGDCDRRQFLKKSATTLAGTLGISALSACRSEGRVDFPPLPSPSSASSRVIEVRFPDPFAATSPLSTITTAFEEGLVRLFDLSLDETIHLLFPDNSRIGLKVNVLAGKGISTNPLVTEAFCNLIIKHGNHSPERIIVWDRDTDEMKRAGFSPNSSPGSVMCFGTSDAAAGYESKLSMNGGVCGQLSRILTALTDFTVNVPVLKDHNLAGISGGLKNMYGVINNPNKYHDNNCDPFVAQLNALPHVRSKLRLTIADAIRIQFEGGPGYHPRYTRPGNCLVIGTDPVAVDVVLLDKLDAMRKENKLPPLAETDRPAKHIRRAAEKPYLLGNADRSAIEHIVLNLDKK